MSKIIIVFILLFSTLSCASNEKTEQFDIIDSHGKIYNSSNIGHRLQEEYKLESALRMILLLTEKLDNSEFRKQLKILNQVNAEDYQYIYVIGNATDGDGSGYSINSDKARYMLSGNDFQIRIYDEFGDLVDSSRQIMAKQMIINHLTSTPNHSNID